MKRFHLSTVFLLLRRFFSTSFSLSVLRFFFGNCFLSLGVSRKMMVLRDTFLPDHSTPKSSVISPGSISSIRSVRISACESILSTLLSRATFMNRSTSIPRSSKKKKGFSSSRSPIPYIAAATCLHISAQSGQLQLKLISVGAGNRPSCCVNSSFRSSGNLP